MIEIYLKYDNMHIFGIINAFICMNNHVISCINSMLSIIAFITIRKVLDLLLSSCWKFKEVVMNWQLREIRFKKPSPSRSRPSYSSFCAGILSNLPQLSVDDVIAQVNSYDEVLKFSNRIKETTTTNLPPMANQTQFLSFDRGRGQNNGRNNRGKERNGGRYVPRCQLCGQYGHRVLECRERFNRSFIGHQNVPQLQNSQSVPQANNLNLLPSPVPQDHSTLVSR